MQSTIRTLALLLVLALSTALAQQAWDYGLLIVNDNGYTFEAPDAAAQGVDAAEFYFNLTGEELPPSGAPAVAVLSALGAAGWELVTVDSASGQAVTYYFKRPY